MEGRPGDMTVTSSNRKCLASTGSVRKLKDNAADWFNLVLHWNKLNDDGFNMAADIVNTRRSHGETPSSSSELRDKCARLQDVVDKMVAVVTKMERLVTSQRGVGRLDEFLSGPGGRTSPPFHGWTNSQFEEAAVGLLDAFGQETRLRRAILEDVAHAVTSDLCVVYLSCWLHRPFIPDRCRRTLEALLLETGHRPL